MEGKKGDITKELEEFEKYKSNYEYVLKDVEEIDGKLYYDGEPVIDENGKEIGECDKWINVGYRNSGL